MGIYIPHNNYNKQLEALVVHEQIRDCQKVRIVVGKKIDILVLVVPNTFSFFHDQNCQCYVQIVIRRDKRTYLNNWQTNIHEKMQTKIPVTDSPNIALKHVYRAPCITSQSGVESNTYRIPETKLNYCSLFIICALGSVWLLKCS